MRCGLICGRPMDIQFTVFDHTDLCAGDQPPVLVEYAKQLRQLCASVHYCFRTGCSHISSLTTQACEAIQPQPPATFNFRGRTYFLQTSLSVRQATETTKLSVGASEDLEQSVSARVVTESLLDLESNQKFTSCQVRTCDRVIESMCLFHELGDT
jgi:hypothetical protein